jgi:HEAT repeat protein/lysophospholipase L1-like esterase
VVSGRALVVDLSLAAGTVALFLGGGELVARRTEPLAPPAPADYITDWQAWDGEFYTVKSTAVGWPPWEDYNTEGLRDREHAIAKPPGTTRVACLGDSVTLGWGIRPQEAWPQVVEALGAASGHDLEVMNVALAGWSTRQELIAWRRIARRYRPDQVLLGICLNDVPEMQNNLSRPPRLLLDWYRRSALVRRIVRAREREIGAVEELFTAPDAPRVREGYARMFADLRTLRDEVRADGALFGVVVFPFRFQVAAGAPPPAVQSTIGDFCRREGIPFLDLLPAMRQLGESAFHDYDHLSPKGARLVAEQLLSAAFVGETGRPSDRSSVAASIGEPVGGSGLGPFVSALQSTDPEQRAAAARSLAALGEAAAPAVPALVTALRDRDARVRTASAWALGDVGSAAAAAMPALLPLLREDNAFLRAGAAFALGRIGPAAQSVVPVLIARFDDADGRVRVRARDALETIGVGDESLTPLARHVGEADCPGRGLAAEALGRLGQTARAAMPELMAAASDPRPDVRWRAVWALGRIGPAAAPAVSLLRAALADPDVGWRAAEALGGIGPAAVEAVPDLVARLADASSNMRWRSVEALGRIGGRDAAHALADASRDEAENVRLAAVDGLIEVTAAPPLAEPAFLAALSDADHRVRLHAMRGLRRLGALSPAARHALDTARTDPDEGVRVLAERLLR